jgi:hypothetical protein
MSRRHEHKVRTLETSEKKPKRTEGTPEDQRPKSHTREKKMRIPIRVPLSKREVEGQLSPGTPARRNKAPDGGEDPVVFETYTPQDRPKDTSIVDHFPPDPSGDDTEQGVVLYTGNEYICYSNDKGKTFEMLANTAVIDNSFAGGEHGDQVMLFIPGFQCFVWYLQYDPDPITKDGAFRIAVAKVEDLKSAVKGVWHVYDWVSSDFKLPGVNFDYPDMATTDNFLYVTAGTDDQGRIVMRFPLGDLAAARPVSARYTGLLSIDPKDKAHDSLRYAHLCQRATLLHGSVGLESWGSVEDGPALREWDFAVAGRG